MIGSTELIVIVLVVFVLFGAGAIPRFAKSLGQAKSSFEKGLRDGMTDGKKDPKSDTESKKEN